MDNWDVFLSDGFVLEETLSTTLALATFGSTLMNASLSPAAHLTLCHRPKGKQDTTGPKAAIDSGTSLIIGSADFIYLSLPASLLTRLSLVLMSSPTSPSPSMRQITSLPPLIRLEAMSS
jgi:hypothetical protein